MIQFLFFAAIVALFIYFLTRKTGNRGGNWIQFYSKGKEAGFSIVELEQLRRLINNCNISDPVAIFSSQRQLEVCIRAVVNELRMSGESQNPGIQDFLSRLFNYCKTVGIKNSEKMASLTNSRQISEGQLLRVMVQGTGIYASEVIKNASNFLTISRPSNPKLPAISHWEGSKISIYFWREDDAGYAFDTEVVDQVFSKGISSLKVEHNDSMKRTQKRRSLRIKMHKPAFVYLVDEDEPYRMEKAPGLRCMLDDISDTGCAFRILGEASPGMRLKLQFALDRVPLCMPGTVRSVSYNQDENKSLVRMQADELPITTSNHILCEVFNMLPDDDEDELPFTMLEEQVNAGKN